MMKNNFFQIRYNAHFAFDIFEVPLKFLFSSKKPSVSWITWINKDAQKKTWINNMTASKLTIFKVSFTFSFLEIKNIDRIRKITNQLRLNYVDW